MNKIDTSQIVDPGKLQPFLGPSLEFLQDATAEAIKGVCYNLIGDSYSSLVGYVLYGVINSPAAVVSFGYIFFNNEIYHFPGITNKNTFVNSGVFVALNTNGTADPITFTDGTTGNVHNVRKLTLVDQANGTGLFNFSSIVYLNRPAAWTSATLLNSWSSIFTPKYRKEGGTHGDIIRLSGIARNTTLVNGALPIFTLPSGYRPSASYYLPVIVLNAGSIISVGLYIETTGDVSIDTTALANSNMDVNLNGIQFATGA